MSGKLLKLQWSLPQAGNLSRQTPPLSQHTEENEEQEKTVLYLAYGSNLSAEVFRGRRGIKPISQVNVYAPELSLTFDLAGIPYFEPCFAGTQYRNPPLAMKMITVGTTPRDGTENLQNGDTVGSKEKNLEYHKDRWRKPLIGVVFEVTLADYARIIATEGGGSGYKDIVVTCYPFPESYNPSDPTPDVPTTQPFKAHTLSPWKYSKNDPRMRGDPSYAQPSARYLRLIMTGARELDFPMDYRDFLASIRPFRITTWRQRIGQGLFVGIWSPALVFILGLSALFAGNEGRSPAWLLVLRDMMAKSMWRTYDQVFRGLFGDGERTIGDSLYQCDD